MVVEHFRFLCWVPTSSRVPRVPVYVITIQSAHVHKGVAIYFRRESKNVRDNLSNTMVPLTPSIKLDPISPGLISTCLHYFQSMLQVSGQKGHKMSERLFMSFYTFFSNLQRLCSLEMEVMLFFSMCAFHFNKSLCFYDIILWKLGLFWKLCFRKILCFIACPKESG